MKTLATLALLAALLSGCSMWDPETLAYSGAAVDVATTAYALCESDNFVEANPLLPGDSCGEVVASSLLIKAGTLAIVRSICEPTECPLAWRIVGGSWWGAAAWNAGKISEVD